MVGFMGLISNLFGPPGPARAPGIGVAFAQAPSASSRALT
jgi:hypothetical protein